jgi:hypothetical protein
LLMMLLNSALSALAVRVCPLAQVVTREMAIGLLQEVIRPQ